jgi:hypothetical protein
MLPSKQEDVEHLLDWIAGLTMNEYMCAALYLSGSKSVGKSLLAQGLARLWIKGPTEFEKLLSKHNDSAMDCPLVLLDEGTGALEKSLNICAQLRKFVGNPVITVEPKGLPVVQVEGALRILVTANDDDALNVSGNGELTDDAKAATAERILHISVNAAAGDFLEQQTDRDKWRSENRIAEHSLWLRSQREPELLARHKAGQRFLIQGVYKPEYHDYIGRTKDSRYAVAEIIIRAITEKNARFHDKLRVLNGQVRVASSAVFGAWPLMLEERYRAPRNAIEVGATLKAMCPNHTRVYDHRLKQHVYEIPLDSLVKLGEELEIVPSREYLIERAADPRFTRED